MRQAQESEIIRLTMDIREGKSLELFKGNEVQVFDQKNMGFPQQFAFLKYQKLLPVRFF